MSGFYDKYLYDHVNNVKRAGIWLMCTPTITEGWSQDEIDELMANIADHDRSKWDGEEYEPYDNYFYGEPDEDSFNRAWLHHIHNNPHHWQHWLLMNDDGKYREPGKVVALEMPKANVIEMVADWWSFSWQGGDLYEMFGWYESHKDCMVLHQNTREYVEWVLDEVRRALDGSDPE